MNKTRFTSLVGLVFLTGCSGVFQSKKTIVEIVVRNESGVIISKPEGVTLRAELTALVKRWPAAISKRQRMVTEKYIAKIEVLERTTGMHCDYTEPVWKPFGTDTLKARLAKLHSEFNTEGKELSARMANEMEINLTNAKLTLETMLSEVEVQNWRMRTETATMKAQFENQCQLYQKQLDVAITAERSRTRQDLLIAGAEVKACFPRATRKVLKMGAKSTGGN